MTHTYEEVRAATIDVLAEKTPSRFRLDTYGHLKIGVGDALRANDGEPQRPPCGSSEEQNALEPADANLFLEVFWDLFRDGIITLGAGSGNESFPHFRVTSRGNSLITGDQYIFLHDVSGFEKQLRAKIPAINAVTLLYLKEALQAFRSGCVLSSSVMLGVATEHTFLLVLDAIEQNPAYAAAFAPLKKERNLIEKINKFRDIIEQKKVVFPKEIRDDFVTQFLAIQAIIRTFRNDSGHPSGAYIEREQAFVNLQLFVTFGRKAYQLIEYVKQAPTLCHPITR